MQPPLASELIIRRLAGYRIISAKDQPPQSLVILLEDGDERRATLTLTAMLDTHQGPLGLMIHPLLTTLAEGGNEA